MFHHRWWYCVFLPDERVQGHRIISQNDISFVANGREK
jgi:hypothetical protein